MRYLMAVILVVVAGWFAYDGYKGWPAENQQIEELSNRKATKPETLSSDELTLAQKQPHSPTDILWQKRLSRAQRTLDSYLETTRYPFTSRPIGSGFTVRHDSSRPEGDRVTDLRIGETPIDPAKTYAVAVSTRGCT